MLPGGVAALCSVLDTDDSGGLSKEEFTQVQERELTFTLTLTLTQVQERDFGLFERIGPNANGIVTLERFTEFIFDLITQEGPSVAAALVLELRQGAARRFVEQEALTASTPRALTTTPPDPFHTPAPTATTPHLGIGPRQAKKKYHQDLKDGRELHPEERELAEEVFTAMEAKLGSNALQHLDLELAQPLILERVVQAVITKKVKLQDEAAATALTLDPGS